MPEEQRSKITLTLGQEMTKPLGLRINSDAVINMNTAAAVDLYDYLEPLFVENMSGSNRNDADEFEGASFYGRIPFSHLPTAEYRTACGWVAEAAEQLPSLHPYKDGLMAALHAAPRYKA